MTVRRGLLYIGVFLVAAGGVTLLASAGVLDRTGVADALQYWPLAVIAIGLSLVLRRTDAGLPAGILAAATPGLLLGGMVVAVPDLPLPCSHPSATVGTPVTQQGSFPGGQARVDLQLSCGEMAVTTAPGDAWTVETRTDADREPDITADGEQLAVTSGRDRARFGWDGGAERWQVTLPQATTIDLDAEVNAGAATLDLGGGRFGTLTVDVNAGDMTLDLAEATVSRLDLGTNAGRTTVHLPATGAFTGSVEANAGSVEVCVPPQLGLRLTSESALGSIDINGLVRRGDAWVTPGYDTAPARADLAIQASVGSVTVSPEGECK